MKLLSITVPCYNSETYMENCLHSLLIGGQDVEIIIVDDGSTDRMAEIVDKYAADYPDMVRVIHQKNGGHGEAVNTGLRHAAGLFFKVVDNDDWVSISAYKEIMKTLGSLAGEQQLVDMVISNFVYEKEGNRHKRTMRYRSAFPRNKVFIIHSLM